MPEIICYLNKKKMIFYQKIFLKGSVHVIQQILLFIKTPKNDSWFFYSQKEIKCVMIIKLLLQSSNVILIF